MISMPQFLDRTKNDFLDMKDFVLFAEQKLHISQNKVYECLFSLGYNCFKNFSIYYNIKDEQNSFLLVIWDKCGEERMTFRFYKTKKNCIKVALASIGEETGIKELEDIIRDLKVLVENLNK